MLKNGSPICTTGDPRALFVVFGPHPQPRWIEPSRLGAKAYSLALIGSITPLSTDALQTLSPSVVSTEEWRESFC